MNFKQSTIGDIIESENQMVLYGVERFGEYFKNAFLQSDAYLWQKAHITDKVLFGKYSELLHNALLDSPKPYRKQVKELVANMFGWTKASSDEFEIIEHKHTSSMIKI